MYEEKPRKAPEIRERHQKLVAATAVRTIDEVFEADRANHVGVVAFRFLDAIDPATGRNSRPCVVSIRAGREEFAAVDLARVDPLVCVRKLALNVRRSHIAVSESTRAR